MASKLLKTQEIKNYQPIGEDGILVYQRAEAFRSAIANSSGLGSDYANFLAIPRLSQNGKSIDWFIPFESDRSKGEYDIKSWKDIPESERNKILVILDNFEKKMSNFGRNLEIRSLSSNDRLYAHFLVGNKVRDATLPAIHFPDSSCFFMVNEKPVITQWGFIELSTELKGSPFDVLKYIRNDGPSTTQSNFSQSSTTKTKTTYGSGTKINEEPLAHKKGCLGLGCLPWLLGLLLLIPLLLLLLYLLWWFLMARPEGLDLFSIFPDSDLKPKVLAIDDDKKDEEKAKDDDKSNLDLPKVNLPDANLPKVDLPNVDLPEVNPNLDLNGKTPKLNLDGDLKEEPKEEPKVDANLSKDNLTQEPNPLENKEPENTPNEKSEPEKDEVNTPIVDLKDKDKANLQDEKQEAKPTTQTSLNLPPPEIKQNPKKQKSPLSNDLLDKGDLRGLDGEWQVKSNIVEAKTGKPIKLKYNFDNGKGTATIKSFDGATCQGPLAGDLKNGQLHLKATKINCTNNRVYEHPDVVCKKGENGFSKCKSVYKATKDNDAMEFDMEIFR